MDHDAQIETCEISDNDLDHVSGGFIWPVSAAGALGQAINPDARPNDWG
jgi:bacteriocin-like protein